MSYSPSNNHQDDILELTDVVDEGSARPETDKKAPDESKTDHELATILTPEGNDQESDQSSQKDQNEDLDLDSFFDEIEKKGETEYTQSSDKGLEQRKYESENAVSKEHKDTDQLQAEIKKMSSRLESLEQSLINLTEKTDTLQRQEILKQDHLEERIKELVQENLEQKLNAQIQEVIDQSLNNSDIPALKEQVQTIGKEAVQRDEIDALKSELKEELSQYIQEKIPTIAAQVIREEIRALTEDD